MYRIVSKGLLIGLYGALFFVGFGIFAYVKACTVIVPSSCTDSGHYTTYGCTNAYDNLVTTSWNTYSLGTTQWIDFHYGSAKTIDHYSWIVGVGGLSSFSSGTTLKLEGSNDNATWTFIDLATTTAVDVFDRAFTNTAGYSYYKWTETVPSGSGGVAELIPFDDTITSSTSTATTTQPGPVENVGFYVLAMLIFGTGIFLAMWIF